MEAENPRKPKHLQWLKLKHVQNARTIGVVVMLVGMFTYTQVFILGLALVAGGYQLSINKWEVKWAEEEKAEARFGPEDG